jgi:phage host-nuclease inhibitor protein Gam
VGSCTRSGEEGKKVKKGKLVNFLTGAVYNRITNSSVVVGEFLFYFFHFET